MHKRQDFHCAVARKSLVGLAACGVIVMLAGCIGGGGGGGSSSSGSGGGGSSSNRDGTATLSWVAPSNREDGSPISLSNIASYEIAYGKESGRYTNFIEIGDASATSARVKSLEAVTYYFAIRVFDTDGVSSRYSEEQAVRAR